MRVARKALVASLGVFAELVATSVNANGWHTAVATPAPKLEARAGSRVQIRALIPTEKGGIGVNPPEALPTPANIEGHTKYLKLEQGTTTWIGVDSNYLSIKVTTTTKKGGEIVVATITKGVEVSKNPLGVDILLSPAVKAKLEEIFKQVTPCPGKKRRHNVPRSGDAARWRPQRRAGPACGLADYLQRVGNDPQLRETFADQLNDQLWEVDSAYGSDPGQDGGWEGDGGHHFDGEDEGYFSDDDQGFFEGSTEGGAAETEEAIVFATEEEAAALGAALGSAEGAASGAVYTGITVAGGTLLGQLWDALKKGSLIPFAISIPKESIQRITRTKTRSSTQTTTSTSTSSSSCPSQSGKPPACGEKCAPTSVKVDNAQPTGIVAWKCSQGDERDCECNPPTEQVVLQYDAGLHKVLAAALDKLGKTPKQPSTQCPGKKTNIPSKWFVSDTSKNFCKDVMTDITKSQFAAMTPWDIYGNRVKAAVRPRSSPLGPARPALLGRSPPVTIDIYKDARFYMEYIAAPDKPCLIDKADLCSNAWTQLVQASCGTGNGDPSNTLSEDASIDVGCGKLSWKVVAKPEAEPDKEPPPPDKPIVGTRKCHEANSGGMVDEVAQPSWSEVACRKFAAGGQSIMKNTFPERAMVDQSFPNHATGKDWVKANWKVSWVAGCDKFKEQDLLVPIPGNYDVRCESLLKENYSKCTDNGGAGGVVEVGCLSYDFWMST